MTQRADVLRLLHTAALGVAASLFLTTTVAYVSANLAERKAHQEFSVRTQLALVDAAPQATSGGTPITPSSEWRSRILLPLVLRSAARLHVLPTDADRFAALNFAVTLLLFTICFVVLRSVVGVGADLAMMVIAWMALFLIATFRFPYEMPSDVLDLAFFAAATAFTLRRWRAATLMLLLLASANRESTLLYGVLWGWCVAAQERGTRRIRELTFAAGLIATGAIEVVVIRWWQGAAGMALVNMREVRYNLELLHVTLSRVRPYDWIRPPSDIGWIVPAASAAVWLCLWLTARREGAGAPDRALVRAAATTLAVTVVFALADEVRVFSPVVWLLLVAIAIRAESSRAAARG